MINLPILRELLRSRMISAEEMRDISMHNNYYKVMNSIYDAAENGSFSIELIRSAVSNDTRDRLLSAGYKIIECSQQSLGNTYIISWSNL